MKLIDADALNKVINSLVLQDEKEQEMIQRIIDYAPEVNEWIPVSERLPEEKQDVLMQFSSSMSVGFWETDFDEITFYVV